MKADELRADAARREAILRLTWTGDGLALDGRSDAGEAHAELDAEVHAPIACPMLALNPAYLRVRQAVRT